MLHFTAAFQIYDMDDMADMPPDICLMAMSHMYAS